MRIDFNIVIICITAIMISQIIMHGLIDYVTAKTTGDVMNYNFEDIIKNSEKIEEMMKGLKK